MTVSGQGDVISVEYKTAKDTAELQLSVTDANKAGLVFQILNWLEELLLSLIIRWPKQQFLKALQ